MNNKIYMKSYKIGIYNAFRKNVLSEVEVQLFPLLVETFGFHSPSARELTGGGSPTSTPRI